MLIGEGLLEIGDMRDPSNQHEVQHVKNQMQLNEIGTRVEKQVNEAESQ
jgi:hypothetical protein